jgi:hypothetical protein
VPQALLRAAFVCLDPTLGALASGLALILPSQYKLHASTLQCHMDLGADIECDKLGQHYETSMTTVLMTDVIAGTTTCSPCAPGSYSTGTGKWQFYI